MAHTFYMDVHVLLAVTAGRRRGVDVVTSQEDGTPKSEDEALLQRASELGHVLFTQDDDLLAIASRWQHLANYSRIGDVIFAKASSLTIWLTRH